jgi:hypothetical protein
VIDVDWVSRGRSRLTRPLRFSTEPFCQGACGSQNYASVPMPVLSSLQDTNSRPRSNVIDRRADDGRGDKLVMIWSMIGFERRSLFLNSTANRVLRSTIEAALAGPYSLRNIIRSFDAALEPVACSRLTPITEYLSLCDLFGPLLDRPIGRENKASGPPGMARLASTLPTGKPPGEILALGVDMGIDRFVADIC